MSAIEKGHSEALLRKMNLDTVSEFPPASFRAKILNTIGRSFGYHYVLSVLMDTKKEFPLRLLMLKISCYYRKRK
jgi:hypothetical protein